MPTRHTFLPNMGITATLAISMLCSSAITPVMATDKPLTFQSGPAQVELVELYTSEGCSSCPPADDWINQMTKNEKLWDEVVPMVFHVDYWDYIGWEDRFAQKAHAKRQRQYAKELGMRTVYTPGIFKNGKEWRTWRSTSAADLGSEKKTAGKLHCVVEGNRVTVRWNSKSSPEYGYKVHLSRLGFDLSSTVSAGENSGRQLDHEFVVLGSASKRLKASSNDQYEVSLDLPAQKVDAEKQGLAVWITAVGSQTPLQATGGWLQ